MVRGVDGAEGALLEARRNGSLHGSEVTRAEILAGRLGRIWLPKRRGISAADLAIAATAKALDADLLTLNVKHFPMFPGLKRPY